MNIRKIRAWMALPAILALAIAIFDVQQSEPALDMSSTARTAESDGLKQNPALSGNTSRTSITVAGNAPCNPEQQVCDK